MDSPIDKNVSYYIDDKNIVNLSGIVGIKLSSPSYKGFGIASDINFLFEPIPYNTISIDKKEFNSNSVLINNNSKNSFVFTKFNPSFSLEASIFYEIKGEASRVRIAVGGCITNYNVYNTYYQSKIDNIKLKEYLNLKPIDLPYGIFVRFSWFISN